MLSILYDDIKVIRMEEIAALCFKGIMSLTSLEIKKSLVNFIALKEYIGLELSVSVHSGC